nr:MAG TPA: hypothetical protein [Bacteriophage sp.]
MNFSRLSLESRLYLLVSHFLLRRNYMIITQHLHHLAVLYSHKHGFDSR